MKKKNIKYSIEFILAWSEYYIFCIIRFPTFLVEYIRGKLRRYEKK